MQPFKLAISEMDGDGKPEITCIGSNRIIGIKNTRVSGTLSFARKEVYPAIYATQNLDPYARY